MNGEGADRPGADYDREGRLSAAALAELALPTDAHCYLPFGVRAPDVRDAELVALAIEAR